MTVLVGYSCPNSLSSPLMPNSLVFKDAGLSQPLRRRGPTIVSVSVVSVSGTTISDLLLRGFPVPAAASSATPRLRPPDARERRALRAKQATREKQRADLWDAAAFAYFMGWPLNMRITVTWDRCLYAGDCQPGHILGKSDKQRCEHLRAELERQLRKAGVPFACTSVRDVGGGFGPHIHLGLHWPLTLLPLEELAWLLARLTAAYRRQVGSLAASWHSPSAGVGK